MTERQFKQLWARLIDWRVAGQFRPESKKSGEGTWRWTRLPKVKSRP